MSRGSLKASKAGIEKAKQALERKGMTQTALAEEIAIARSTISKFFNYQLVDRTTFLDVCDALDLDWKKIFENPEAELGASQTTDAAEIEILVQEVRCQIRPNIQERCSTMRVLDMTQPIALTGERGIYTKVNILEKVLGRRRLGIAELLQTAGFEKADRFGLSRVTEERIPGLSAVKRYGKLMVLGKPGAGKTTFLKYLAMQCSEGQADEESLLSDHVPLFITLKDFAEAPEQPGLLFYITQQLESWHIPDAKKKIEQLFRNGRAFLLLDGLDEVREKDVQRVLWETKELFEQFSDNTFVITCRIGTLEYTFQNFVEVEVADFEHEQIAAFIHNWFRCKNPNGYQQDAEIMLEKLEASHPIKELASSPLLLTLLCLEFEESLDFPLNRSELYERGLRVLLSKWDASRRIERDQVYKRLPLKRKEDLLSQIAFIAFQQASYFFKQRVIENHIADYIGNLPDAQTDLEALLLDSEAVLKSIEAQHGLLIERAKGIFSFSHLTFQEYFTAKRIVGNPNSQALDDLARHITEPRWREVFMLTVGMLQSADYLLQQIKHEIDSLLAGHAELQTFLSRANRDTPLVSNSYKEVAIRSFCCYRSLTLAYDLASSRNLKYACDYAQNLTLALDRSVNPELAIGDDFALARRLNSALDTVSRLTFALNLAQSTDVDLIFIQSRKLAHELAHNLTYTLTKIHSSNAIQSLKALNDQLPALKDNWHIGMAWWKEHGQSCAEQLKAIMLNHCNLGQDWQFTSEQTRLVEQFLGANLLLVECLNSECYVSRSVREEIEATLLLSTIDAN